MISKLRSKLGENIKSYRHWIYNNWALNRYNNAKYDTITKRLKTFKKYKNVNLGNYPFVFFMIDENNSKCLSTFLKGINYQKDVIYDEENPLHINPIQFAYLNNVPEIVTILEEHGANINIRNSFGQNILHITAINNRQGVLKLALDKGIEIDSVDNFKNTPLHYAAKQGLSDMCKLLLENKAKKDILNVEDKYPIHLAVESQELETVKLLKGGMEMLNYPDVHPIHLAARLPSLDVLKELLKDNKAFVFKQDKSLLTTLHYAVLAQDQANLSELLLMKPAVDKPDILGNTALHLAVLQNNMPAVKLLVEAGADLKAKNVDKLTPVDCAFHSRSKEVIRYLQTLGRKDLQNEYFNMKS